MTGDGTMSFHQDGAGTARLLAAASLLAVAALTALVVDFLLGNVVYLVVGLIGGLTLVGAGWVIVTSRGYRRAMALVVGIAGLGALVAGVVGASRNGEQILVHLVVVAALAIVTVGAGRAAMARSIRVTEGARFHRIPPPAHPVLICNPWSGGGKVASFAIVELAASLGVETVLLDHGLDLEQLARQAIARGADCLGMAGGDGSQALVAAIAVEHDLPFVCVTAGTRNHFALDLGLDRQDPRRSVHTFRDAVERRVDFATVNGRLFVNNVSLGIYATIVQKEGYREAKAETATALLPELLGHPDRPFDLQFTALDGDEVDGSFLIQVSNNPYVLGLSPDVSQRRRLDTGQLGVVAVNAERGTDAAAVVASVVAGPRAANRHARQFQTRHFEVRSRSGRAFAGVDGEALEVDTPLEFDIHPGELRLLVPADNMDMVVRQHARDVRLHDLVSLAGRGRSPRGPR